MFGREPGYEISIAGHMWLMRYFSEHPEELDVLIATCR